MATTLHHNGRGFPGIWENLHIGPVESQNMRTGFQGVHGISEIRGGRKGRVIQLQLQHFDEFNTVTSWEQAFRDINRHTNENGTLELRGNLSMYLSDCTFEGAELIFGPLPDEAGTQDGGWWATLLLTWFQNSIEND